MIENKWKLLKKNILYRKLIQYMLS